MIALKDGWTLDVEPVTHARVRSVMTKTGELTRVAFPDLWFAAVCDETGRRRAPVVALRKPLTDRTSPYAMLCLGTAADRWQSGELSTSEAFWMTSDHSVGWELRHTLTLPPQGIVALLRLLKGWDVAMNEIDAGLIDAGLIAVGRG